MSRVAWSRGVTQRIPFDRWSSLPNVQCQPQLHHQRQHTVSNMSPTITNNQTASSSKPAAESCQTSLFHVRTVDAAARLLQPGADANARDDRGNTPLIYAVMCGRSVDVLALLLDHGAEASACDRSGVTALHYGRRAAVVKLLVKHGAKVNPTKWYVRPPLLQVVQSGNAEAVEALIEAGASVHQTSTCEYDPEWLLRARISIPVLEVLIKYGALTTSTKPTDDPLMLLAARTGELPYLRCLVRHGFSVHTIGHAKATPLFEAAVHGHRGVVVYLLDNGASIHGFPSYRYMPLLGAACSCEWDVVADLLARGAVFDPSAAALTGNGATTATSTSNSPVLNGSTVAARRWSRIDTLDMVIQHCSVVLAKPMYWKTDTVSEWRSTTLREWTDELKLRVPRQAPTLKLLWRPLMHKVERVFWRLDKKTPTYVKFGVLVLRLWKLLLAYQDQSGGGSSDSRSSLVRCRL